MSDGDKIKDSLVVEFADYDWQLNAFKPVQK